MKWPKIDILPEIKQIVGIDEVGRGSLAGPMVLGVCKIKYGQELELEKIKDLDDSKKLSTKKRQNILNLIKNNYTIVLEKYSISSEKIDRNGIRQCYVELLGRIINQHDPATTFFLLDYGIPVLSEIKHFQVFKQGDSQIPVIALASIFAKESRDKYMQNEIHKQFPEYGFDTHVGYATKKHRQAIKKYGLTACHRKSFCTRIVGN